MSTPGSNTAPTPSAEGDGTLVRSSESASSDPRRFDRWSLATIALVLFCAWSVTCLFLIAVSP